MPHLSSSEADTTLATIRHGEGDAFIAATEQADDNPLHRPFGEMLPVNPPDGGST